jgi:hypothetical protein
MKVYRIAVGIDPKYAHIHAQMGQDISQGYVRVMWDDWLAKGNVIPDFIFSAYIICRKEIAEDLESRFKGINTVKLSWEKNPKESAAKNTNRLKWLPTENVELSGVFSDVAIPVLPQSTVKYGISGQTGRNCIKEVVGGAKLQGDIIMPREQGMGLFFSADDVGNYDFFKPEDASSFFLCTETAKAYIENKKYSNIIFLEVGDVVD